MSYLCEYCDKKLSTKKGLKSHVTQTHPKVREKEKKQRIEELRSKEHLCPYCDEFGTDNLDSLRIHVQKAHDLESPSKQLRIDLFEGGEHPTCECGCGEKTKFKSLQKGFCDFLQGHWAKIPENQGWAPGALEKAAETRRKQFENGEREPWNKGLSLEENPENEGLQKLRRKNLKENSPERARKISESLTGRELSEAEKGWNEKLQKINDEYWSKEENREAQREWRSQYVQKDQTENPSDLEEEFMELLETVGVDYNHQIEFCGFIWDFEVGDSLIEVHGDFYHVNNDVYPDGPGYDVQRQTLKNDKMKKIALKKSEYEKDVKVFWEHDIENNRKQVVKRLIEISE